MQYNTNERKTRQGKTTTQAPIDNNINIQDKTTTHETRQGNTIQGKLRQHNTI